MIDFTQFDSLIQVADYFTTNDICKQLPTLVGLMVLQSAHIAVASTARRVRMDVTFALIAEESSTSPLALSSKTPNCLCASGLWQCILSLHTRRVSLLVNWQEI